MIGTAKVQFKNVEAAKKVAILFLMGLISG